MWGAGGLSAVMAGTGLALLVAGPSAQAAVPPGVGSSYAQSLQDTPKDGALSVGVVLGEAIAGHINYVARAQSQGLDETAIGTSLQGYNCGQPPSQQQLALVAQPLQAETGQPGADQGYSSSPGGGTPNSFGSDEFAQATAAPFGLARTSYADMAVPGDVFAVSGMVSKASSGLVDGQRVAQATEDIKSISLVNGLVQLNGLHWDATYPSGGAAAPSGHFTIGSMTIHGTAVPTQNPTAALTQANAALQPLGLQLGVPQVTTQQGILFVSPLELDVIASSVRDQILDPVVNGEQQAASPVVNGLENGFSPSEPAPLVQALCQSDTPITVADIAVASIDGGGSYVTSFGGVNATSGKAPVNPFTFGFGGFTPGSSRSFYIPGTSGSAAVAAGSGAGSTGSPSLASASTAASPAGAAPTAGAAGASGTGGTTSSQPTENIAATGTAPGGPLLGIGLGGLAALLLLAEGDRRLMRRAQRGQARFADLDD
jgi:hypothetical protein